MTEVGQVFHPNKKDSHIYNQLFHDVFLKTYDALEPLHKRASEITGYSET
jgi:hypothetical protein